MENSFKMVAKTFKGLEDVLQQELVTLGASNVEPGVRMVSFEGDLEMMYRANICLRTALRILKPIVSFDAADPDELYDHVRDFDWEQYLGPDSTFAVDSTVNSSEFTHSKYVTYRVKDGIADHFMDKYGRRPSIRLNGADLILNVHIINNYVTLSLDSSGEPLNRRGYRVEQTDAPINEVLAAGIIMKTGWHGECDFADPMCGSGTFLIEAAMIAGNINPGVYRKEFAFERWPDFNQELLDAVYDDDSEERDINCNILGGDIDPEVVGIARKNIRAAHFEDVISLVCKPMQEWDENDRDGILVTNPPYGERLRPDDMATLYKQIGTTLKQHFQGWHAWIIGYKDEHFAEIGLKPSVKYPILNGALECSLREYVLFSGRYNDFKADGGDIANKTFNREYHPHPHRERDFDDRKRSHKQDKRGRHDDGRREYKRFEHRDNRRDFDDRDDSGYGKRDNRRYEKRDDRGYGKRDDRRYEKRDDRGYGKRDDRGYEKRDDRRYEKRDDRGYGKRDDRRYEKRDDRRSEKRDDRGYQISGHGPQLSSDDTIYSNPVRMRGRKRRDD